jgi:hypothetical protein
MPGYLYNKPRVALTAGALKDDTMSLNAMTNDLPRRSERKAEALALSPEAGEDSSVGEKGGATQALNALSKFIPTEMLAPYAAALSLATTQLWNASTIYWWFVIATPVVFLLFEFAKVAMDHKPWPIIPPLAWRAVAATIAFAVWGLSVPTNPLQSEIGGAAVTGFAALVVSPILTALDAIALRLLGVQQNV